MPSRNIQRCVDFFARHFISFDFQVVVDMVFRLILIVLWLRARVGEGMLSSQSLSLYIYTYSILSDSRDLKLDSRES